MRALSVANRYAPWSTGGYEVVSSAAVGALRVAGHEIRVLTTVSDPSDRVSGPVDLDGVHRELRWYWRDGEFPRPGLRETVRLERANAAALRHHLEEFEPDVVIWWGMGGMSLSLIEQVRRAGVPSVGLVGDEWMLYGPGVDAWTRLWRGRLRLGATLGERVLGIPTNLDLDNGARWLFNSQFLLSSARAAGWRLREADIAPPGVDPRLFAPRPSQPWGWRLLYCGRADPRKGVASVIEALPRLPAEAVLTIHGDGDHGFLAELASLASRLGVAERVRFGHSEHDRVPEVYSAADAVVFPVTWQEPWGLAPLEAMAIGRPLVASRAGGGPTEFLQEGDNCLQFEPGDAGGLANALLRLATDEPLRARLVSEGHATASRFTEQRFHERLERELRRLAGDRD
ncbi:MAG TPA: glycosyltransferase family 4 protein [Solirubrobacteraceae bacterium]|nr:glycosyltransferase family 4 protein [Solirubrobacteraceae bacterium]